MKKIFKKILELYLYAPYFVHAVIHALRYSSKNNFIQSVQHHKKCIVIGNGPSLIIDMNQIKEAVADRFVVNHFADSDFFEQLKPQYYILLDPYFWSDNASDMHVDKRLRTFNYINEKVSWNMTVFVPSYADVIFLKTNIVSPYVSIKVYNASGLENVPLSYGAKLFDTNYFAPHGVNVILHAIFLAMKLGYFEILVFGIDTTTHKSFEVDPETNKVFGEFNHFYGSSKVEQNGAGTLGRSARMSELLKTETEVFKTFEILAMYAKHKNIDLVNCSSYTMVDSLKRSSDMAQNVD